MTRAETRVVLVTGAAGNVGRAVAWTLAAQGLHLAAIDRLTDTVDQALDALGGRERHLALGGVDLMDPAACAGAISAILDRYGRLDGIAHTVGGFAAGDIAASEPEQWRFLHDLNVMTTVHLFRAAWPRLEPGASLVATGAGAGLKAPAGLAAYAASKSAVHRLVEAMAEEGKPRRVRVNAVLPSIIDTPQNRAAMPQADPSPWVTPHEIAEAVAFLLAPAASGVTGALLPVVGRV